MSELLERVADRTPAPGGGSATALACALAAALVQMAARFGRDQRCQAIALRAGELRAQAVQLAEVELGSYAPVLEALRAPDDAPGRAERLSSARAAAAQPPLAIATLSAELSELGAEVAAGGSRHVIGDALAATLAAEAGCRAAGELVALNLAHSDQAEPLARARELAARAAVARAAALATASEVCVR